MFGQNHGVPRIRHIELPTKQISERPNDTVQIEMFWQLFIDVAHAHGASGLGASKASWAIAVSTYINVFNQPANDVCSIERTTIKIIFQIQYFKRLNKNVFISKSESAISCEV